MPRRVLAFCAVALLVVSACGGDDSSSDNTVPQASAADLAAAHVSGPWTVTITIDTQTPPAIDPSIAVGDVLERQFVLGNGCNVDTGDCSVIRESAAGQSSETWTRQGGVLTYRVELPVTLECEVDGEAKEIEHAVRATITLTVTDAILLGDGWTATAMAYAREAEATPTVAGCPTGLQTESG
ncbi:MAG: hypothetical protein EHM63_03625, partial [Actinobacteria bacterium]